MTLQVVTLNYTMVRDEIDSKMAVGTLYKQLQHYYTFALLQV